jgi:hypothetical protein
MGRSNAGSKNAAKAGPEIPSGADFVESGVATVVDFTCRNRNERRCGCSQW